MKHRGVFNIPPTLRPVVARGGLFAQFRLQPLQCRTYFHDFHVCILAPWASTAKTATAWPLPCLLPHWCCSSLLPHRCCWGRTVYTPSLVSRCCKPVYGTQYINSVRYTIHEQCTVHNTRTALELFLSCSDSNTHAGCLA